MAIQFDNHLPVLKRAFQEGRRQKTHFAIVLVAHNI
jgi:hypothetical protein